MHTTPFRSLLVGPAWSAWCVVFSIRGHARATRHARYVYVRPVGRGAD
jgi:hypothetical protein